MLSRRFIPQCDTIHHETNLQTLQAHESSRAIEEAVEHAVEEEVEHAAESLPPHHVSTSCLEPQPGELRAKHTV